MGTARRGARALWLLLPMASVAYIWNQWLKMSSRMSIRKARCAVG
jgi:hypothetical protein